ncbi:MAG TPA: flavodoxin domain-containing protein [Kofleriaceae bacterium]|nr:flavodoxin domain-containing protein [Kofleriaceae bacterium]
MADKRRITCPETGHLEEVEIERSPLGLVVIGCSRYPDESLGCPRECARRMDRREHLAVEDRDRILIVVDNRHDEAGHIAAMLAEELAADGLAVERADLSARAMPPLADYDAVVIGAPVRVGRPYQDVIDYVRTQRSELATLPAFLYTVGGRGPTDPDLLADRMTHRTGWRPTMSATFADASPGQRTEIRAFARLIGDEIPAAPQPTLG